MFLVGDNSVRIGIVQTEYINFLLFQLLEALVSSSYISLQNYIKHRSGVSINIALKFVILYINPYGFVQHKYRTNTRLFDRKDSWQSM